MESRFSPGRAPPPLSRSQRLLLRKQQLRKKKKIDIKPKQSTFKLSKTKSYGFLVDWTLNSFPQKTYAAITYLHKTLAPPLPDKPKLYIWKPADAKQLTDAVNEIIRCRFAFRRLYLLYLHYKSTNKNQKSDEGTLDPITLEPISWPVRIVDLKQRAIYEFEQKSLAKTWSSNLTQNTGIFSEPRFPTNPLTNLSLNIVQLHSAMKIIQRRGNFDWVLSSFSNCKYDIDKWKQKFGGALYVENIEKIFADAASYDRLEMLLDFAELQFDYHGGDFPKAMFRWIFRSSEVEDYAKLWIKECKQFYIKKYSILDKDDLDDLEIKTSIDCAYLTQIPNIVKVIYQKELERQYGRYSIVLTGSNEQQTRNVIRIRRSRAPERELPSVPEVQQAILQPAEQEQPRRRIVRSGIRRIQPTQQASDSEQKVPEDD